MDSMTNSKSNGLAPTASLELVLVGRPFKVISFLASGFSVLLMTISTLSSRWMVTDRMRAGLWEECRFNFTAPSDNGTGVIVCDNQPLKRTYSLICAILSVMGVVLAFASTVLYALGLLNKDLQRKFRFYNATLVGQILATICFLVPLITYPMKFMQLIHPSLEHRIYGVYWECGWPYGTGWGGVISLVASTLLLYLDKPSEELVYREKVYRGGLLEE